MSYFLLSTDTTNMAVSCVLCDSIHQNYPAYLQHLKEVHQSTLVLRCLLCPSEYTTRTAMVTHYQANHSKYLMQVDFMSYQVKSNSKKDTKTSGFKRPNTSTKPSKKVKSPAPPKTATTPLKTPTKMQTPALPKMPTPQKTPPKMQTPAPPKMLTPPTMPTPNQTATTPGKTPTKMLTPSQTPTQEKGQYSPTEDVLDLFGSDDGLSDSDSSVSSVLPPKCPRVINARPKQSARPKPSDVAPYLEIGRITPDDDIITVAVKRASKNKVRVITKVTVNTSIYDQVDGKLKLYRREVQSTYPETAPEE